MKGNQEEEVGGKGVLSEKNKRVGEGYNESIVSRTVHNPVHLCHGFRLNASGCLTSRAGMTLPAWKGQHAMAPVEAITLHHVPDLTIKTRGP